MNNNDKNKSDEENSDILEPVVPSFNIKTTKIVENKYQDKNIPLIRNNDDEIFEVHCENEEKYEIMTEIEANDNS